MEVLQYLNGRLKDKIWSWFGPRDAVSLKDDWVSPHYLAIDQLPIVLMVENYRTELLWDLFMNDPEIQKGLAVLGFVEPNFEEGFPEAVVTLRKTGQNYRPESYEIRRHPDRGQYLIPFWSASQGEAHFALEDPEYLDGPKLADLTLAVKAGRNFLALPDQRAGDGRLLRLTMTGPSGQSHVLPIRLW
jgi:hypothetical protein